MLSKDESNGSQKPTQTVLEESITKSDLEKDDLPQKSIKTGTCSLILLSDEILIFPLQFS